MQLLMTVYAKTVNIASLMYICFAIVENFDNLRLVKEILLG